MALRDRRALAVIVGLGGRAYGRAGVCMVGCSRAGARADGALLESPTGLTGASIVVLADRYGAKDIPTLDERRFRAVRASDRRPFRLLPADG